MDLRLKERDRISVLRQAYEGLVTVSGGAVRIGVTPRHFRRLLRRFEAEGDAAAIHALRGRRSNRALPQEVRERALAVATDPLYRDFGPTLLAEHLEIRCDLRVSADTLRRWMMEAGLWERARRRAKHRSRRPRRAALGELAQWDSSVHPWLEDRAEGSQVLISIHDDATSRLMSTRFVERDNGAENRRAMMAYLRRHGRPLAVYTDHAGHFGQWQSEKSKRTDTLIARALSELGIELILAGSPQAAGEGDAHRRDRYAERSEPLSRGALGPVLERTLHGRAGGAARRAPPPSPGRRSGRALRRDRRSRHCPRLHDSLCEPALADPGAGSPRASSRHQSGRRAATQRRAPIPHRSPVPRGPFPASSGKARPPQAAGAPKAVEGPDAQADIPQAQQERPSLGHPPRRSRHDHRRPSQASRRAPRQSHNGKAPPRAVLNSAASR